MTEPDILKSILMATRACKEFSVHEVNRLIKQNRVIEFSVGSPIVQQGKLSPGLFIIIDGKVSVMAKILGEGMTDITTLECGDIIGEISFLENISCSTSAIADTNVKCLLISNAYFDMIANFYPKMKFKLMKAITEEICLHLQVLQEKISALMKQSHMTTRSLFGKVVKTFTHPAIIPFNEIGLTHEEIRRSTLFKKFSEDEYTDLMQSIVVIKTSNQCPLITEHEQTSVCYIIIRGAVQTSIIENDMIAKLSVLPPMNLFCNIACSGVNSLSSINYTTCERAVLLKLSHEYLVALPKKNPRLWYKLYNVIYQSFAELEKAAKKLDIRLNSEVYNR